MKIIRVNTDSPVINIQYCFVNGSQTEGEGQKGLLHLAEHLHFRDFSSDRVTNIKRNLERVGAEINAYTSEFCINFYTSCLPQDFDFVAKNMCSLVFEKHFNEDDVSKESEVVYREFVDAYDNPTTQTYYNLYNLMYEGYTNTLGLKEDILGATAEKLDLLYDQLFGKSNLIILVGCPNGFTFDDSSLTEGLSKLNKVPKSLNVVNHTIKRAGYDEISRGNNTAHIYMGKPYASNPRVSNIHEHRVFMECASIMLGESWMAPMMKVLREEKGLCYSAGSGYNCGSQFDDFLLYAAVSPDKKTDALSYMSQFLTTFHTDERLFEFAKELYLKRIEWDNSVGTKKINLILSHFTSNYNRPTYDDLKSDILTYEKFKTFISKTDFFNPLTFSTSVGL